MSGNEFIIGKHSYVSPEAIIGKGVTIGDYVTIHDNVKIGDYVTVVGPTEIGSAPTIWDADPSDPRISSGRVIIEDNCVIQSFCVIQRGFFSNTHIQKNTYIGNNCGIAHDVYIGEHCVIFNGCSIVGYAHLGDNVCVKSDSIILGVKIGDRSTVYFKSLVKDNFPADSVIVGNPATTLKKYCKMKNEVKNISKCWDVIKTLEARIQELEEKING